MQKPSYNPNICTVHASAPGRVNLIGEHTDYTGGLVLPMAIPFVTRVRLFEQDFGYTLASSLFGTERYLNEDDRGGAVGDWSDYPVGVLRELQKLGVRVPPFRAEIDGNVPLGAGLSSSASVEVATAVALLRLSRETLPERDIALLCQRAENLYVGSPCGIMDQYVVTAATAGHALLLNTRDYSTELLPMNTGELSGCAIVVVNSMVRHTVTAGSDYEQRRKEVEAGQEVLRREFGVLDLGDAQLDQLLAVQHGMTAESVRRCRHIITENERVREAAKAMQGGDARVLGQLMTAAHASERDDFECSVPEVDFLVETAIALKGCLGARLTGGGFGGCTVNLVELADLEDFVRSVKDRYLERYGIDAEIYICAAADGAIARAMAEAERTYA